MKKVQYIIDNKILCKCVHKNEMVHVFSDEKGFSHWVVIPENSACTLGWEALELEGSEVYHMLEPSICHKDTELSSMKPVDYKDTCVNLRVYDSEECGGYCTESTMDDYDPCPHYQMQANIDHLTKWDDSLEDTTNKACVVKNEKEFIVAMKEATGTFFNDFEWPSWHEYEDHDGDTDNGTHYIDLYYVKPAYWAFEHTCTVGVDEIDLKGNPVAKYRFNKKTGKTEELIYNFDKKEWGSGTVNVYSNTWKKDTWQENQTGWCSDPENHCVINKRIEIQDNITLTKPLVIEEQKNTSWPFVIEITSKGNKSLSGKLANDGCTSDKCENAIEHQLVFSKDINIKDLDITGKALPILPDLGNILIKESPSKADVDTPSPIFTSTPFLGATKKTQTLVSKQPDSICDDYGVEKPCYKLIATYADTTKVYWTSYYAPNWAGIYIDNKFQFAACDNDTFFGWTIDPQGKLFGVKNPLNSDIFKCSPSVKLETSVDKPHKKPDEPTAYAYYWHSSVIIPASILESATEYKIVFNWVGRNHIGYGSTDDDIKQSVIMVAASVKSPLICTGDTVKFKNVKNYECITSNVCATKNGITTGDHMCKVCAAGETTKNNLCIKDSDLSECRANDRVWGDADKCGACEPGFKDFSGECVDTTAEKAKCDAKSATNGKWTYNSTSNQCSLACNSKFINENNVCQLKCSGNGKVPNFSATECVCDATNYWVQNGSGCKCAPGYEAPNGVCVAVGPVDPDKCSADSDCDDDEICKDGKCAKKEPQPFKGECKSTGDCGTGMVCSSKNICECDTNNDWNINDNKDGCKKDEEEALESMCKLSGGEYLESSCLYDKTQIACLKSEGKWETDVCWHDLDGDGTWTPDTDLPENNSNKSGCGCAMGNASLPESLGSILPYLIVLAGVGIRRIRYKM